MPATDPITLDILNTTYTKGVLSSRYDRARRRGIVRNLPPADSQNRQAAVDAALEAAGTAHPLNTTLPLLYIETTRYGPTKMWVDLQYGRHFTHPIHPPTEIADFTDTFHPVRWYRNSFNADGSPAFSNGTPAGVFTFVKVGTPSANPLMNENAVIQHYTWQQFAQRVSVPTILNSNPANQVSFLRNKTNSGPVAFGGENFPINTLMYVGMGARWFETNNQIKWAIRYNFLSVPSGFLAQSIYRIGGMWDTQTLPSNEMTSFVDAFPYGN